MKKSSRRKSKLGIDMSQVTTQQMTQEITAEAL